MKALNSGCTAFMGHLIKAAVLRQQHHVAMVTIEDGAWCRSLVLDALLGFFLF